MSLCISSIPGSDALADITAAIPMPTRPDHSSGDPNLPMGQRDALFDGFLEAAPDAVVIVDGDGVIAQVNGQTERLFGYRREELLGRPLEMLMPERYRGCHVAESRAYAADPHPRSMGRSLDQYGLRKDGDEFSIDISLSPLPSDRGVLVASIIRDMSAQRHLEGQLRQRTRDLEDADRQKDNFLSAVAHELRSPLSVLSLVTHLLRSPQADAAIREQALGRLERQTAHMSRVIEDLLDLSRFRCGARTPALRREVVDMRTVLVDAVEMGQALVDDHRHQLTLEHCAKPCRVSGDVSRLVQVVSNLVTNAAKFTPDGGHIWLSAANEGETVAVRIRDDGVGIPQEMLSRVFDLFTQVDPAGVGRTGGLGIGLALVRLLVELHGGTVEATSAGAGKGSEFVVRLPALSPASDAER